MSTAILHAGSFIHDFNDIVIKNQNSNAKINGLPNNQNFKDKFQRNDEMHFARQQNNGTYMTNLFTSVQKRSVDNGGNHHAMLARTVSTPVTDANQITVSNLFTSLNDILNSTGAVHRKLERTQSEPIPQSTSHTSRYKTELCRPFEEAGECKYGDKCQFAHGMHELRNLQRHPKYKTELCRTFHSVGFCPYGARCHFIHSSQEALTHNKNVAAYQARLQQQQSRIKTSSISTGSDRETSSIGSLSPTMTHAQNQSNCFGDQSSPTNLFSYSFSPSNSPILSEMIVPITPPPQQPVQQQQQPPKMSAGMFVKPTFVDQNAHANAMKQIPEDARLPIFNQISATIDSLNAFKI